MSDLLPAKSAPCPSAPALLTTINPAFVLLGQGDFAAGS
jgi:hypothetical protein